jgi:hypothetical protein
MKPQVEDFVLETTTSEGLGDYVLGGSPDEKFQPFEDVFTSGTEVLYGVIQAGVGFETGRGTLLLSGTNQIIRSESYTSSNNGNPVNWGAGVKVIYSTFPAARAREWVRMIEVIDRRDDPPGGPSPGDKYLVGVGTGAWATQDNNWTTWDGSWTFETPEIGNMTLENVGMFALYKWNGTDHDWIGSSAIIENDFQLKVSKGFRVADNLAVDGESFLIGPVGVNTFSPTSALEVNGSLAALTGDFRDNMSVSNANSLGVKFGANDPSVVEIPNTGDWAFFQNTVSLEFFLAYNFGGIQKVLLSTGSQIAVHQQILITASRTIGVADDLHRNVVVIDGMSVNLTLENPDTNVQLQGISFFLSSLSGTSTTLDVLGGGLINGSSTKNIPSGSSSSIFTGVDAGDTWQWFAT